MSGSSAKFHDTKLLVYLLLVQEKLKREKLRKELESESADREEKMQVAFATAVELQQKAQEEASALKAELARATLDGQQAIDALAVQVGITIILSMNL